STVSRSTIVSAACVCTCAPNSSASSLAARSNGPEQLGTKRGAKQTRSRSPAAPCQRRARLSASASAVSVDSASSSGAPSGCAPAKQRLAEVDMRLDEAGDDETAGAIAHLNSGMLPPSLDRQGVL